MRFPSYWLRNGKPAAATTRRAMVEALEERRLFSTLTVTSLQDSGAGSLRAEIATAQSGDTIVFSSTLFSSATALSSPMLSSSAKVTGSGKGHGKPTSPPPPPPTITPNTITLTSGELLLAKNLTIQGPTTVQLTISGSSSRVFEVAQGSTITLSGVTISKGSGVADPTVAFNSNPFNGFAGGILNHGTLDLSGCTVSGNSAYYGGGGILSDGTMTLSGCTVSGNAAYNGGGISNRGTATLFSSVVSNNAAQNFTSSYPFFNKGGGIYNNGTLVLSGCTVSGNTSWVLGGGIFNDSAGTITVKNSSSITGNSILGSPSNLAEDVNNLGVLNLDSTSTIGVLTGNPATPI